MKYMDDRKGFSLVELMIVVAVIAILIGLALPSYTGYVRKANRGEAQQLLMNWANNQEIWRANDLDYASDTEIVPPSHAKYTLSLSNGSATTYTLTATALGDQLKDKEQGDPCSPMALNQANLKTPDKCW